MISRELTNFGISFLVAWIVWRSYRKSVFSPGQKYSTFWPRFWTGLVDSCVLWPLGFIVSLLFLLQLPPLVADALSLLSNTLALTYTVWLHTRYGQTVGKMVCKVRVVDHLTEGGITARQALLRECVPVIANLGVMGYFLYLTGSGALSAETRLHPEKVIDWRILGPLAATPALWFLIEVFTIFSNAKRRALHDLIAGTTVVRTNLYDLQPATEATVEPRFQ